MRSIQSVVKQSIRRNVNAVGLPKSISAKIITKTRFSTVAENTVYITFVDQEGNRASVPGLVGQSLLDVARKHNIDLEGPCGGGGAPPQVRRTEDWVEMTYGEGPQCMYCHVQIPSRYDSILPEQTPTEKKGLLDVWEDECTPASRLACLIYLDKRHDGMVVLVPDAPPTDIA